MQMSSGQHELFSKVVVPHLAEAHRLARYLTGCRADADDVLQEATVRLFRFVHSYRGGDARSWVLQVARNTAFTWLRANRQPREELPESVADEREDVFAIESRRQEIEVLRGAIDDLPGDQRTVLVLRELSGFQYGEIATTLRIPIGTVMSRLSRGRRILKRRLSRPALCDI